MKLVKKEDTAKNVVKLTIEIDKETFAEGINQAYRKNVKKINIPGFRKGKAPRGIIEQFYGEGVFYEDAVNFVCPDAYEAAVKEAGIEPVDRPEIDIESIGHGEPLVITALVTVKPEVELGEYKGVSAEKVEYKTTDEDVQKEIDAVREKNSRMITVEDRAVKMGDITVIDFEGFVDGVAFAGGKGENHTLEIGSGQFIPGFEDALVGAEIGKETDVNVTFPEEYHAEELKGKPAVFKVTVKEIKEKELPELNDDFAKDVSDFDTLEEYKNDIKAKLDASNENRTKGEFEGKVLEAVCENCTVEIPECMIDSQIDSIMRDFDYRLSSQGLNLERYLQITGSTPAAFREQFKDQAAAQVKTNLVLEAIAAKEDFAVTDEDVEKEMARMAEMYGMELDKIKELIHDAEKESMKQDLKMRKAVDFLVENAAAKKPAAKKTAAKKPAAKKTAEKADDAEKP
ncbi:MAG: trigger factor, partial [Ruminococcaceae bacterium]|nr:trigger factor [Oscillospiraceae bacterium]